MKITSSEDPIPDFQSYNSVSNLTIFRALPGASDGSSGSSAEKFEQIASVGLEQPKVKKFLEECNIFGVQKSDQTFLQLHILNQEYCDSNFACQARGTDSEGRELVTTTQLMQVVGEEDKATDQGGPDSTVSLKLLSAAQQADEKMVLIEKLLQNLDEKVDLVKKVFRDGMVSLEQKLGEPIIAELKDIEEEVKNVDSKVSALSGCDSQGNLPPGDDILPSQTLLDILATTGRLEGTLNSTANLFVRLEQSNDESETCTKENFNTSIEAMTSRLESMLRDQEPGSQRGVTHPDDLFPGTCKQMAQVMQAKGEQGILGEFFPCDMTTQGGGWIVIQRRATGDVDFYRGWEEYKEGFGSFDGDFWLGNDKIHAITSRGTHELRVELEYKGERKFAHYKIFSLGDEISRYVLTVLDYDGTAGDSLSRHHGQQFTTKDRDNDARRSGNCADRYHGAWWYLSCHDSNLNGKWDVSGDYSGLTWRKFTGRNSVTFSEMKIRRAKK